MKISFPLLTKNDYTKINVGWHQTQDQVAYHPTLIFSWDSFKFIDNINLLHWKSHTQHGQWQRFSHNMTLTCITSSTHMIWEVKYCWDHKWKKDVLGSLHIFQDFSVDWDTDRPSTVWQSVLWQGTQLPRTIHLGQAFSVKKEIKSFCSFKSILILPSSPM